MIYVKFLFMVLIFTWNPLLAGEKNQNRISPRRIASEEVPKSSIRLSPPSPTKAKDKLPIDWNKRDETTNPPPLIPAHQFRKIFDGPESDQLPRSLPALTPPSEPGR